MRVLATIGFSFSTGVFLAALLPWDGWQLYAAAGAALLALVWLLAARRSTCFRRGLLILLPLAVSLAYFAGYRYLVQRPVEQRCGAVSPFTATVCDWPQETERGCRITVKLDGYPGARAVLYGEPELLDARPGNTLAGTAQWQSAAHIYNNDLTHFTARGVYALLYGREDVQLSEGSEGALRWLPQRAAKAFRERIAAVWDDPRVSGFLTAELTGDKSAMDEGDYLAMQETGLAHLFAVSGLHCAFLVTLLSLLVSRRRRLLCAVTIPALLFYMVMVGLSPSVVRACIMQMLLLVAPLFRRNSDPLTSLAAALLVILLVNPFAAASVSLQLSFSATLGMVLLSPRLYRGLTGWYKGKNRVLRHGLCFVMANLAATLSAVVFTAPLTAYYFRIFVLVAPLSSLLAVPAAGWSFMTAFVTALLGFVWLPLARILGALAWVLVRYILLVAEWLMGWRYHAIYFTDPYPLYWLLFVYTAFIGCAVTPDGRRKYAVASVLSAVTLIAAIWVNQQSYRYGALSALALDVGQGESVILWSQDETALVDCGSSNSYSRRHAAQHGRHKALRRGGDPLSRRPHQRAVRGAAPGGGGQALPAGYRGRIRRAGAAHRAGAGKRRAGHLGNGHGDVPAGTGCPDGLSAGEVRRRPERAGTDGTGHVRGLRPADHRRHVRLHRAEAGGDVPAAGCGGAGGQPPRLPVQQRYAVFEGGDAGGGGHQRGR